MSARLVILGAGGHGKVIADTAASFGPWQDLVFLDDSWPSRNWNGYWPIIGRFENLTSCLEPDDEIVVGLGDAVQRLEWTKRVIDMSLPLATVVHRCASVSPRALLGPGTVVFAAAAVNIDVKSGPAVIVNTGATIDHDCVLGAGVHVCPGANLAGNVKVGERSWIGIGSSVKQGVRIGKDVTVGAGSVVLSDVQHSQLVAGIPAKSIRY